MRESDRRLSAMILGDDHDYESRSPFYHSYEDVPMKDPTPIPPTAVSSTPLSSGDRVQVGGPLGGYGTVETVYTRDAKVRVRMDQTFRLMVLPSERVEVIEKKEREK